MKTQISKRTYRPKKRYSGVHQQQGRMITDADWNELGDVVRGRLVAAIRQAVASGAPREDGLGIEADGSIRPGAVVVDGIPARLPGDAPVAYADQPDFDDPPAPTGAHKYYVDVWERTVTPLEDPDLRDVALHGADTCTREQTLVQVKWCPATGDPEDPAQNPTVGDAPLKLTLRKIFAGADPCVPCIAEVDLDERIGNYLFRVEVHDVVNEGGNDVLVLKWSRENGAEQARSDAVPDDFTEGDWTYEFFETATERNLGHHLATGYSAPRGLLKTSFSVPGGAQDPKTFVRRWDGYCKIDLTAGSLLEGVDKGAELKTSVSEDAHGFTSIGEVLRVNLDLLELNLGLETGGTPNVFLAGDHWMAPVREAGMSPGDVVLGTETDGELPQGVRHHYLLLAELDAGGVLVSMSDARRRQLAFPPLTDLRAADVGYTDNCPRVYSGAENVQQALDALCGLTAANLPYVVPECGDATDPTARTLLGIAAGESFTAPVLDELVCRLGATTLPIAKRDSTCLELRDPGIVTVQDALEKLCAMNGRSGCVRTVGTGGDFESLQVALETFQASGEVDLSLCLLPEDHTIESDFTLAGKRSLKITGGGHFACRVLLGGAMTDLGASNLEFSDIHVEVSRSNGRLVLHGARIQVEGCFFSRRSTIEELEPMVSLRPDESGAQVTWSGNTHEDTWRTPLVAPGRGVDELLPESLFPSGNDVRTNLEALLAGTAADENSAMEAIATGIAGMSSADRALWSRGRSSEIADRIREEPSDVGVGLFVLRTSPIPGATNAQPAAADRSTLFGSAFDEIGAEVIDEGRLHVAVGDLVASVFRSGYGPALGLASEDVGGVIRDNVIRGSVVLLSELADSRDLLDGELEDVDAELDFVVAKADLSVSDNTIWSLGSRIPTSSVDSEGRIVKPVPGHRHVVIHGNTIEGASSTVLGRSIVLSGNEFVGRADDTRTGYGLALTRSFRATGNGSEAIDHDPGFEVITPDGHGFDEKVNLMRIHRR